MISVNRKAMDLADMDAISRVLHNESPNIVINAAAYTDVDGCESQRSHAWAVNAEGPRQLAQSCRSISARLIHVSTDYVFDGEKPGPYTEEDSPNSINVGPRPGRRT